MTNEERAALDERIRDMKRRGIPASARAEILKREMAEAGPSPEEGKPPSPSTPVVPNDDSAAERAAESDGPDATGGQTMAEPRADSKAHQGRNEPKRRKRVDRKDAKTMTALPVSTGTDARRAEQPPAPSGGLLKPPAAAAFLAIGKRKLWELTNSKRIPCVRIDRAVRYRLSDLERWIEQHREDSIVR